MTSNSADVGENELEGTVMGSESHPAQPPLEPAALSNGQSPSLDNSSFIALHSLMLLADSALPLGSFAFSSGLESYLAHRNTKSPLGNNYAAFNAFLKLSLATLASASLPYVFAAYRDPSLLEDLDNDIDASTPCTVARRASIAQGKALLSVWNRSFRPHFGDDLTEHIKPAIDALSEFQSQLRDPVGDIPGIQINGHLAPLWGVVTKAMGISLKDATYMFLFSHARTVVSAGVRASAMGPYQAQHVLAATELQDRIKVLLDATWNVRVEDAGQTVPSMDLWVGRHEKLYSRIFNS